MSTIRYLAGAAVAALFLTAALPARSQLNDTGQQACSSTTGVPVACDDALFPGQDAAHGRDALADTGLLDKAGAGDAGFDFTALDEDGAVTTPHDHACVRDHVMGLVWSARTQPASDWAGAASIADGKHCGLSGWRLPTRQELLSLVHHGSAQPAIELGFFPDTVPAPYWTADLADGQGAAWTVDFGHGDSASAPLHAVHAVRLVATDRNQPPRITLGEDIVIDNVSRPEPIVLPGWARDIAPGPASEAGQRLTATLRLLPVEDQKALAFSEPPRLDLETGTLSFTVAHEFVPGNEIPGSNGYTEWDDRDIHWTSSAGLARVELTLKDDGGTRFGGSDTTVREFTIFLDPHPLAGDLSHKNTWKAPCVPVVLAGWDADSSPRWLPDQLPRFYITRAPSFGYLSAFAAKGEPQRKADEHGDPIGSTPYMPRGTAGYIKALCYIPFRSTFTGFDTFTYKIVDRDGNVSRRDGVISIEIEEN